MVILGEWVFLISEVPLYVRIRGQPGVHHGLFSQDGCKVESAYQLGNFWLDCTKLQSRLVQTERDW